MSNILALSNRPSSVDGSELLYGAKSASDALISVAVIIAAAVAQAPGAVSGANGITVTSQVATPVFGTSENTITQGNDARFIDPTAPPNWGTITPASGKFTSLAVGSSSSIAGFSVAVGNALGPLINYQGSGLPAVSLINRLIFARPSPAASDGIDVQIQRNASFTGGNSSEINKALFVSTTAGSGNATHEWNFLAQGITSGTSGGLMLGAYHQGIRLAGGSDAIWATVSDCQDKNILSSSLSGQAVVSHEIDITAARADDATNMTTYGGLGSRKALNIVAFRLTAADAVQTEFSNGLWFTTGLLGSGSFASDTLTNYQSAIGFGINCQVRSALDTRGAITPAGSSNPVSAVMMASGHVIDFNGGVSLTSSPGRTLVYNSSGSKLQYLNGATEVLNFPDAGGLVTTGPISAAAGSFSGSITLNGGPVISNTGGSLYMLTAGGAGLHVANTASGVNGVSFTPGATGVDPIIATYGGDAARNIRIAALGSGGIVLMNTTTVGFLLANTLQLAGATTTNSPTIAATGSDTNISLTFTPKGTGLTILGGTGASVSGALGVTGTSTLGVVNSAALMTLSGAGTAFSVTNNATFGTIGSGTITISSGPTLSNISGVAALLTAGGGGLNIVNSTSAINGILITPGATGVDPILSPYGGDAARNLRLAALGTGSVVAMNTTLIGFASTNSFSLAGATTTNAPNISVSGSDAAIDIKLTPKGTGMLNLNGTAATAATTPSSFSATSRVQIKVNGVTYWIPASVASW